jgi:hypothetical protein
VVIRAYDAMVAQPAAPAVPQTLPEALRLAADLAEQKAKAETALALARTRAEGVADQCSAKLKHQLEVLLTRAVPHLFVRLRFRTNPEATESSAAILPVVTLKRAGRRLPCDQSAARSSTGPRTAYCWN